MGYRRNRLSVSTVCLLQLAVCLCLLLVILLWRWVGGAAYEAAADWYHDTVSDSVIVTPQADSSSHA